MSTPVPAPCGTYNARRRHARHGETCTTCTELQAAARQARLVPCGTVAARRRHRKENQTCPTCDKRFKRPDPKPCGTPAAYSRHIRRGETPCTPCTTAHRAADAAKRRTKGVTPRTTLNDLLTEIRFLLNAGEGEHRIVTATGYLGRAKSLRTRLVQAGHQELAIQIFNSWELAA